MKLLYKLFILLLNNALPIVYIILTIVFFNADCIKLCVIYAVLTTIVYNYTRSDSYTRY